jgi:NAD(P)-dependent dehydrogenase (short-subunit alcohol dehydrogenase family)
MTSTFDGKVVVIAGGGAGLGAASAARLAQLGASVVVGDLRGDSAQRTAKEIADGGGVAHPVQFDISIEESVGELFSAAVKEFGHIDGLVNVAADLSEATLGVDDRSDALTVPLEVWNRTFAVGLTGFLLTIRQAVPRLLDRGGGSIVNISSEASVLGLGDKPAYSVAKAGVNALTRHVARRWGTAGIRCNAVSCGLVGTEQTLTMYGADAFESKPFLAPLDEKLGARQRGTNARGRVGVPGDIASAVVYLLSDDSDWVTGQVLHVSGGAYFGQ